jgi:hypothetical protein
MFTLEYDKWRGLARFGAVFQGCAAPRHRATGRPEDGIRVAIALQ